MVDAPIRLGIVGAGVFAHKAHVPALRELSDRFEIVAVAARTQESADRLAAALPGKPKAGTDMEAVFARSDVEAVNLILPIPLLPSAVERALAAGKHVISEKPIATSLEQARALIAFHDDTPGMEWMVAENWRYEAAFVAAAQAVDAGRIGDPVVCNWAAHVPIRPGHAYHATKWRRTGEVPGGLLLDAGVHFVAALRMILGEISEVSAFTKSQHADLPPADTLSASLRFGCGALGSLTMTYAAGAPWPPALHVVGTEGSLRVTPSRLEIHDADGDHVTEYPNYSGLPGELAAFADRIRKGTPHRNTPDEALRDVAVCLAVLASAEAGAAVSVTSD